MLTRFSSKSQTGVANDLVDEVFARMDSDNDGNVSHAHLVVVLRLECACSLD